MTGNNGYKLFVKEYLVKIELGLHARPSSLLVKLSSAYGIQEGIVKTNGSIAQLNSIWGLLILGATKGSKVTIEGLLPEEKHDKFHSELELFFNDVDA